MHSQKSFDNEIKRRCFMKPALALAAQMIYFPQIVLGQAEKTGAISIGQSAPLTGPLAKSAGFFRDATQAVFKDVNERGGISGRLIELITLDDKGRSELTATNIKLLASQHQVIALFGFMGAGAHRVGATGAQQEGLPYIAPVSGAGDLRNGSMPWVFNLRSGHKEELRFIAKHAQQTGLGRLGILFEYNSQGWELRDAFAEQAKVSGLGDAALVSVDQEGSEFSIRDAVVTLLNEKPNGIVLGADYATSAKFVQAARAAGFNGAFYALSTVGGQALMDQVGVKNAAGISVTQVVPFPWSARTEASRNFLQFCQRHQLQASFEGVEAWMASRLLVDALRKARPVSPAKLMAELDKSSPFEFGGYIGSLSNKARTNSAFVDLSVYSRDGRFRA